MIRGVECPPSIVCGGNSYSIPRRNDAAGKFCDRVVDRFAREYWRCFHTIIRIIQIIRSCQGWAFCNYSFDDISMRLALNAFSIY